MSKTSLRMMLAAALALGALGTLQAQPQWQWLDGSGRKVYSDRPPPPDVPQNRILKAPRDAAPAAPAAAAPASTESGGSAPAQSSAGEDAELKARVDAQAKAQAEAQAREQAAQDEENAKIKQENERIAQENERIRRENAEKRKAQCAAAQATLKRLEPGRRVMTTDAKGNAGYMDDATREAQRQRAQAIVRENC
ncbi:DUF4124 domain-containing protein [Vandammella animalimorsus]|uniref:DUF4124 domain-containing protein n=1 Tax=Vandammella animalimorsus TaxID=2029117 RepID=A0A2A2AY30_9BURK|nr:DUF4124 domain-containing protein [Vandammella animalimorsus]PAT42562.1 DUF4124 domain-containing protein [Vandammella animalimorsus]